MHKHTSINETYKYAIPTYMKHKNTVDYLHIPTL